MTAPPPVLYLSGELDIAHEEEVLASFGDTPNGQGPLVVDLADLAFIDSTGIRAVLALAKSIASREVVLRSPMRNVRRVLELVEIEHRPNVRIE
jgi:anti-anti-sigma factor